MNRITLTRDPFAGELAIHCSRCDRITRIGTVLCCQWAKSMYWRYVYGKLRRICVTQ